MKRIPRFAALFAAFLILSGCASFQSVPFGGAASQKVHRIGLLTVYTPPGFTVFIRMPVGMSFGFIGGSIAAGEINKKSAAFTKKVEQQGYSVQRQLTEQLKADLQADGYTVNLVSATRTNDSFLNSYPPAGGNQAFLDVVVKDHAVGYRAAGNKTDYYPYVFVTARLVSASGSEVLYSEQVVYDPVDPPKQARTIPPSGKYAYQDFDHLMADPKEAVEGLKEAVAAVAVAIASDLR